MSDSFATLWTVARQAPLSMDFPGKNTQEGWHFLLQGLFLTQGLNPRLLHWQDSSLHSHPGSPMLLLQPHYSARLCLGALCLCSAANIYRVLTMPGTVPYTVRTLPSSQEPGRQVSLSPPFRDEEAEYRQLVTGPRSSNWEVMG